MFRAASFDGQFAFLVVRHLYFLFFVIIVLLHLVNFNMFNRFNRLICSVLYSINQSIKHFLKWPK